MKEFDLECPCGEYQYSVTCSTAGKKDTPLFCPFCGVENEEVDKNKDYIDKDGDDDDD